MRICALPHQLFLKEYWGHKVCRTGTWGPSFLQDDGLPIVPAGVAGSPEPRMPWRERHLYWVMLLEAELECTGKGRGEELEMTPSIQVEKYQWWAAYSYGMECVSWDAMVRRQLCPLHLCTTVLGFASSGALLSGWVQLGLRSSLSSLYSTMGWTCKCSLPWCTPLRALRPGCQGAQLMLIFLGIRQGLT